MARAAVDPIRRIRALRVQPDEVLVVKLPASTSDEAVAGLRVMLDSVGLEGRSPIFVGDVEFAVVKKDPE
jgi:hypothetical protein